MLVMKKDFFFLYLGLEPSIDFSNIITTGLINNYFTKLKSIYSLKEDN